MPTALYSSARHAIKKEQYLSLLNNQGDRFTIGADINAKHTYWRSRLTTTKAGEFLASFNQLKCAADPPKIPDPIDFFIIRNLSSNYIHVEEQLGI